jgi:hypothetical protein
MKLISFIVILLVLFFSCTRKRGSSQTKIGYTGSDSLKKSISLKEKKLKNYYQSLMADENSIESLPNQLINSLLKEYQQYYKTYPGDTLSPYYIDKIHQLFTQEKQYTYAVDWVDTLLYHYPNYTNKSLVLYSAATTSDLYLLDTNRVKKYYNRMLNECPKLKNQVKNEISHRLKYLEIPYLEYISKKQFLK